MKMKQGDTILSKSGADEGKIINAPKPPKKWTVKFLDGRTRTNSKSFWKKYYTVVQR